MTASSTEFNPFGEHLDELKALKEKMARIGENVRREVVEKDGKWSGVGGETEEMEKVLERVTAIVKKIEETAVQSLLTELLPAFSNYTHDICHSAKLNRTETSSLTRPICVLLQAISDRLIEPFTSDLLEKWAPLFDALATGKPMNMKEAAGNLWKASFGKVRGPLRYPGSLRSNLEKLPKRFNLTLPADESRISRTRSFDESVEEEAMDGMGGSTDPTPSAPESSTSATEFSQILSQQGKVDVLAERIMKEKMVKDKEPSASATSTTSIPTTSTTTTPTRRRQSKIPSLLDEDSCDFVAITATPPSSRKTRLTDRQKEKLAEASGPRTTINYVDEESQSGFQKKEQLKAALTAMNFDVGEESVSAPILPKLVTPVKKDAEVVEPEENQEEDEDDDEPKRRASKRARKSLFDDVLRDSEVVVISTIPEAMDIEIPILAETTPTKKKNGSRQKKTPKQCIPEKTPPPKKRLRSSALKVEDSESPEDVETADSGLQSPEAKLTKKEEVADDADETVKKAPKVEDVEMKDSDDVGESEASPPKTPRTPSILRVSRRGIATTPSNLRGGVNSPVTEKRRNRVHFGEEYLPQDTVTSSPQTPRRRSHRPIQIPEIGQMVLAVDVKSPQKTSTTSDSSSTKSGSPDDVTTSAVSSDDVNMSPEAAGPPMGLLEIQDPTSSTSPFFRGLIGCTDPIDRVVRKLAPMCLKTAVEAVKRSLNQAGVKTIGEFASLSKKQINDLTGLRNPKEKCARSVLAEYEAMKRAENRASEERISAEDEEKLEKNKLSEVEKLFEEAVKTAVTTSSSPPLRRLPMIISCQKAAEILRDSQDSQSTQSSESSSNSALDKASGVQKPMRSVKIEPQSPQKSTSTSATKKPLDSNKNNSILQDATLLHRICNSLSRAHSLNQLPREKWISQMNIINTASILFKSVVQERGIRLDEWDDVDMEEEDVENTPEASDSDILSPEADVKTLRGVYRRISRHHACGDVDDDAWRAVMTNINEAAVVLKTIATATARSV